MSRWGGPVVLPRVVSTWWADCFRNELPVELMTRCQLTSWRKPHHHCVKFMPVEDVSRTGTSQLDVWGLHEPKSSMRLEFDEEGWACEDD